MAFFKPRGKHSKDNETAASPEPVSPANNIAEATKAISELAEMEKNVEATAAIESLYGSESATEGTTAPAGAAPSTAPATPAAPAVPVAPTAAIPSVEPLGEQAEAGQYISADFNLPSKKKRKLGKAVGITAGVIVGILLIAYLAGVWVFSDRFLPNTSIGDLDISLKTSQEAESQLDGVTSNWKLKVSGNSFDYDLDASRVKMSIDSPRIIQEAHNTLNSWSWPVLLAQGKHDMAELFDVAYSQDELASQIKEAVDKFNEGATPPANATIEYSESSNGYVIKPETLGTQLNYDVVLEQVKAGVDDLAATVKLTDEALIKPSVTADDPKLQESLQLANGMLAANISLNLGGQTVATVDHNILSSFITVDGESNVAFNEDTVIDWVANFALQYETIGSLRSYTRADGKQISVQGGPYGWKINREELRNQLVEAIKSASETTVDIPCYSTAAVVSGAGNRDWGARYIDVDLSEQHVYFYDDSGNLAWESDCISGKPDGEHDTVPGVWTILDKKSPSKLIGYENGHKIYEQEVQYWMPFENVGIGLHDADWQPGFGGTMYADGYGSHGCVNLPPSKAAELYNLVQVGDVVSCHW